MNLALAALAVLPFLPALGGREIMDDYRVHNDEGTERLIARGGTGWLGFERLLTRLSHWATRKSPVLDHSFNIVLHLVTVQIVFSILGEFLSAEKAMLAAVVFAVHPLQVHSVGYVSGRAGLLSFFFAALIVRVMVTGSVWGIPFGLALAFLGLISKEDHGVYLAAIALGAAWITWG